MYTIKLIDRICNKLITYKFITNKVITKIEAECQCPKFLGRETRAVTKRTIVVWVKGVGRGSSDVVDAPGIDKSKGAEPKYNFDAAPKLKTL